MGDRAKVYLVDKPIHWLGSSRDDLRSFPQEARRKAGFQLRAVQRGEMPTDFKPMPSVGSGAMEIRIHVGDDYRVFYAAQFEETVYVLHAFQKKTRRTARKDIQLGQQRYREMLQYRRQRQRG